MATTPTIPTTKIDQFQNVPREACWLKATAVEFGDNGEGADTVPVRLVARSPFAIEHWYWGKIAHDLTGAFLRDGRPVLESKERINLDYEHNGFQVIGFGNKFAITAEGLVVSGAITPMPDSYRGEDMAKHVVHKSRLQVPYEASINFGGSGMQYRVIDEGEVYSFASEFQEDFEGPGIVIVRWPLRNVAICSLGMDGQTSSDVLKDGGDHFTAELLNHEVKTMAETAEKVSVADLIPKGDESKTLSIGTIEAETQDVETPADDAAVDLSASDNDTADESAPTGADVDSAPTEFDRSEGPKFIERFGERAGPLYFTQGLSYQEALETHVTAQAEEITELKSQVKLFKAQAETAAADDALSAVDGDGTVKAKYSPFAGLDDEEN